jgi:hypothetical protein
MAKVKKIIVKSGIHYVNDGKGGRKLEVITPKRLQRIADTHQKMVDDGIKIPAPERHFFKDPESGKFASFDPINVNIEENNPAGSKSNFGWWEKMELVNTQDEKGEPCVGLQGTLDVPHEDDEKKVGTTVKDTSIFVKDKWVDGKGKEWKGDVMTHTALVTKPIEKGQENFTTADGMAIAMSHRVPIEITDQEYVAMENMEDLDNVNAPVAEVDVVTLKDLLKKIVKVHLPDDTTSSNISERLELALRQKELDEEGKSGTLTKPPEGAESREVPVVMSEEKIKVEDISNELVMSHPVVKQLQATNETMLNALSEIKRDKLTARLSALDLPEDKAKDLQEKVAKVVMSFESDQKAPIEETIELLEATVSKKKIEGAVPDELKGTVVAMSNEEITNKLAEFGMIGVHNPAQGKSQEDLTAVADSLISEYN